MVSKTVIWKIWTICSYGNTWFIGTLCSKRQNKDREEDNKLAMSKPAFGDKEEYGALTCPAPLESLCSSNTTQCNACACWNEGQKHEASSKHLKSKRTGIFWSIHNQKALLRSQVAQGTATRVICTCMDFTDWAGNHLSPFQRGFCGWFGDSELIVEFLTLRLRNFDLQILRHSYSASHWHTSSHTQTVFLIRICSRSASLAIHLRSWIPLSKQPKDPQQMSPSQAWFYSSITPEQYQ